MALTYYTYWCESGTNTPVDLGSMGMSQDCRFKFVITETVNVANNTSTFTVKKYACPYSTILAAGQKWESAISVKSRIPNNVSYKTTTKAANTYNPAGNTSTYYLIGTDTFSDIPHNADGSGTVTFQGSGTTTPLNTSRTRSVSGTITMTKINRLSTVTTDATSTTAIGSTVDITINQVATGVTYTHKLYYKVGTSDEIEIGNTGTAPVQAGTVTWTIPASILQWTSDTASPLVTIVCYTIGDSGTSLGSTTTSFNVTVPQTYSPIIGTVSFSEQSSEVAGAISRGLNVNGSFVQNKSKVRCSVTFTGKNGANISSYLVSCGTQSYSNSGNLGNTCSIAVDFDSVSSTGTQTVSLTVTDSRGLTSSINSTFNVLAYNPPSFVTPPLAYRCNVAAVYNTTSQNVPKVTVNDATYVSQLTLPGSVTFSYNGSSWKLLGNNVQLSTYGITITGTPINGDTIVTTSGVYNEDGTLVRIRVLYRISDISGNLKKLRLRKGSGSVFEQTLPSYTDDTVGYDSVHMYSNITTNSTVAFYCSLVDCFWTAENNNPYETIVGPSFVLQSFFGDCGGVGAGKGITYGREASSTGWNFYAYKANFYEGNYTKTEDIDGLVTEKTNGIYVRYVK